MNRRSKIEINGLGSGGKAEKPGGNPTVTREEESSGAATESTPQAAEPSQERTYDPPPRRPRSERKNAFNMGAWLLEGVLGVAEEIQHNDLGLPEEFWVHAYAARKESLLAVRALLDATLEQWEEDDRQRDSASGAASSSSGAGKGKKANPGNQRGSVDINFK